MTRMACVLGMVLLSAAGAEAGEPAADLRQLFDDVWAWKLEDNPLFATMVGEHRFGDRLPSMSPTSMARREAYCKSTLQRLEAIDRNALSKADRISYDMFGAEFREQLAGLEFKGWRIPITADSGFHMAFARLPSQVPLRTVKDYESYIARLNASGAYFQDYLDLMREGLRSGWTLPRVVLDGYDRTISSHLVDEVTKSELDAPFRSFPGSVPVADQARLREAGRRAIRDVVVPAYRALLDFMTKEYVPGARATTACSDLPGGRPYYEHLVKSYTTLAVTPDQVHAVGLAEVARIRKEMDEVIRQVGFTGDFAAFVQFLRTDPRFYAKTPEELLKQAAWIAKRMDGKLPSLFKTLPRLPYTVEPVPDHMAPKYTAGRYVGAPVGGTRPGVYWVNTYALESRPLYALEALTLHEAVPGHHLQNALRQELADLPNFRRFSGVDAYGEGWGLYSERLGLEAGFYKDPYSNFGRLTYEMWRACRLVVDTGLHAKAWTRQQAIDFLASNTALSLHEVRTEIDRYISWPGQALAYKMGELKIRELRKSAEDALGERFDVRAFHDVVLLNGPVPLPVLEGLVRDWVETTRASR